MQAKPDEIRPADFFESPDFSLEEVPAYIWNLLDLAAHKGKYAFHTPVVANVGKNQVPDSRVIVLREAKEAAQTLSFHTDYRSPKVEALKTQPDLHWTFYDGDWKLQLRVESVAQIHHQDEVAEAAWENSRLSSRRCYLAPYPPGSTVPEKHPNLPEKWRGVVPDRESTEEGKIHFCKIVCHVRRIDWLYLNHKGNLRGMFGKNKKQDKTHHYWIAP